MSLTEATFTEFKVGDDIALAGPGVMTAGDWITNQPTGWLLDAKTGVKVADLQLALEAIDPPVDGNTHQLSIELDSAACAGLAPGPYRTDIRFVDADGKVMHSPTYVIDLKRAQTGVPA